jgi:hypothetical protein
MQIPNISSCYKHLKMQSMCINRKKTVRKKQKEIKYVFLSFIALPFNRKSPLPPQLIACESQVRRRIYSATTNHWDKLFADTLSSNSLPWTLLRSKANLHSHPSRLLPIWRLRHHVLEVRCNRRLVALHPTRLGIVKRDCGVVEMIGANPLVDTKEAAR